MQTFQIRGELWQSGLSPRFTIHPGGRYAIPGKPIADLAIAGLLVRSICTPSARATLLFAGSEYPITDDTINELASLLTIDGGSSLAPPYQSSIGSNC